MTVFLSVLLTAIALVGALSVLTNRMVARWDMWYYRDMAINGLRGNSHLATPFAYRPIVPLTIYAISHTLHIDPEWTFHIAAHVAAVVLLVLAFYWMRSFGASERAAWCGLFALGLNYVMIRYPLFTGTMIDIYAYIFTLIAAWFLFRRRFNVVLLLCAIGLFLKEFMVVPILTQGAVLLSETPRKRWLTLWLPLGLSAFAVVFYVLFTRATIPVYESFDHIDPRHPETLLFFFTHPLSPKRWFNIIYSYLSFWLPCLLLMTRERWQMLREQLAPYGRTIFFFLFFQLFLLMYGGNNLFIFVGYSLPILLLVMYVLVDRGRPATWELMMVFVMLVVFNRIGTHIPTYDEGRWDDFMDYYGGFGIDVRLRSILRFIEIWAYFGLMQVLRKATNPTSSAVRAHVG
ncbi:MAG: hypothetical protein JWP63_6251 [Candidatus Solibacter sp.]|jgi:hypothetical protein|nr:hypothetical protein [Candidatus Solibacter sp.]